MNNLRCFYEKTGRAKYISHLDMNRCMQRAIKRSGLPLWYTEGFNPHIYLTFLQPLSLGFESRCEIMDFKMEEEVPLEEIKERLNDSLPEGIHVSRVALAGAKAKEIAFGVYDILFPEMASAEGLVKELLGREPIEVVKKTKKGEKVIDLKPLIRLDRCEGAGEDLLLGLTLPSSQENTVNPSLVCQYLKANGFAFEAMQVTRTRVLKADGTDFS